MVLKAGVVGAGVFGRHHARKYQEAEGVELVAMYDVDGAHIGKVAHQFGVSGFIDYDKFLDTVDVLTLASPACTHGVLGIKALEAGCHVLVEKPIALTLSHADEMVNLSRKKGLTLQVGHQERYVFEAFGILARDHKPRAIQSRRLNTFSGRAMDVSVTYDLMIHDLDLISKMMGDSVTTVTTDAVCQHGSTADFVETEICFHNRTKAKLIASRLEKTPSRDLQLTYQDGEIYLNFLTREVKNTTPTPLLSHFDGVNIPLALKDPLAFGTQSFVQCVKTGQPPVISGEEGRKALVLALKIEEAAQAAMIQRV